MIKRILISGSNGFTGRYVIKELLNLGYEVFGLTSDCSVTGKTIDLNDQNAIKSVVDFVKPTAVIHLAAIAYVDHGFEIDFLKINVEGTSCFLNLLRQSNSSLNTVIVASSANIYGNTVVGRPISENTAPNPQNFYAESKLLMEEMIKCDFADLPITIVRPFNYTGVGQSVNFLVPKIVKAFKERQDVLKLGNIEVSRDFSDVRFVAKAYSKLIEKNISGELLNICSGCPSSIQWILQFCEKVTGHRILIESDKTLRRKNEIKTLWGDPSHMSNVLGETSMYTMEDTLSWMLSSNMNVSDRFKICQNQRF